jgi:antitoxin (DNA-binding transcriptional repressor) of toxin-antitoxin stability system
MKELTISVTVAARRFADCINRVRYQGTSFILHKNGVPVARIVPVGSIPGADLEQFAVALREVREEADLEKGEAAAMSREVEEPGKISPAPIPPKRPALNW